MGEWIEITSKPTDDELESVSPFMGEWIEISMMKNIKR